MIRYAIAFIPRSGSNFLCDLLKSGGLGNPTEYYYPYSFAERRRASFLANPNFNPEAGDAADYWRRIEQSQGGYVTGLKTTYESFGQWRSEVDLEPLEIHWIYLVRSDWPAQAVSWLRAEATGLWSKFEKQTGGEPELTREQIRERIETIRYQYVRWNEFFEGGGAGGRLLRLDYANLGADTVEQVASFIGAKIEGRPESAYTIQRDERTQNLLEQFENE